MTTSTQSRLGYSPIETAGLLGIGKNTVYEMIRQQVIPALRFGRRIVVPRAALDRLLESALAGMKPSA